MDVLIVDDSPDVRELAHEHLVDSYEVAMAATAAEAIQWLGEHRAAPSVVLLDLAMPEASGFRVLEYLQWSRRPARVVIHTAQADMAATVQRQRLPLVTAVLLKPVGRELLLEQVAAAAQQLMN